MPDWEPYFGRDGFVSFLQAWLEPWETHRIEIDELIDVGERVLAVSRESGEGRTAGSRSSNRRTS
jgi:hypothetical protein